MRPHQAKPLRYAFTLIELLVVVAIIAILAAMLLPALGTAKEKSRVILCMNNLKQLALLINLYSLDHSDLMPILDASVSPYTEWWNVLRNTGYMSEAGLKILVCPTYPPYKYDPNWVDAYSATYGLRGGQPNSYPTGSYYETGPTPAVSWEIFVTKNIKNPSEFIMLADTTGVFPGNWYQSVTFNVVDTYNAHVHLRHFGMANCAFLDGHVELCSKFRIRQSVLAEMPTNSWIRVAQKDLTLVQLNP
jgi:prepilin-type N-terminal cleavage/methylation domain-containing protein/prepilin-type processing-associated H-X9-DG protein